MTPHRRVPTAIQQERPGSVRHRRPAAPVDDPITVVEDPPSATRSPSFGRVAWLAAYTVGLATSAAQDEPCVERLLTSNPSVDELRATHGLLIGWEVAETTHNQRALRLVEDALTRVQAPPRREQQRWVTEWSG